MQLNLRKNTNIRDNIANYALKFMILYDVFL